MNWKKITDTETGYGILRTWELDGTDWNVRRRLVGGKPLFMVVKGDVVITDMWKLKDAKRAAEGFYAKGWLA